MARSADEKRVPHALDLALGLRIREQRKAAGMTQAALARAMGMTFQQVQKYERAFTRVSFSRLIEISRALGCRAADLIEGLDERDTGQPVFRHKAAHLQVRGAADLLAGYARLNGDQRRVVLDLLLELAQEREARTTAAAAPARSRLKADVEASAPCP